MLAMLGRLTHNGVEELADALAESLNWQDEQKEAEVRRTFEILADRHALRL